MNFPKGFLNRVLTTAFTAYILFYYSELVFWSKITPDQTGSGLLLTYVMYFMVTYTLLAVISYFKIRSVWALFLAGALYGWLIEGVIVQTMYENFPLQISWTGLAWHALISVLIGWYFMIKTLTQNNYRRIAVVSLLVGVFYGVWAVTWWLEEGIVMSPSYFLSYALITSLVLIGSYWMYINLGTPSFILGPWEVCGLAAFFVVWFYSALKIQPMALFVLPPLLIILFIVLRKNRRTEQDPHVLAVLQGKATWMAYELLLIIPIAATAVYACAFSLNILIPNWFIVGVTIPLGFVLFVTSIYKIMRRKSMRS